MLVVLDAVCTIVVGVALALAAYRVPAALPFGPQTAFFLIGLLVVRALVTSRVVFGLRRSVREARQLGQYTLDARIGEGDTGVVFRARHTALRRPSVVKLLPPEKAGEASLARFERALQISSRLSSPNTGAVYGFGRADDGVFYYAMEFLDGIDLQRLVLQSGPLPPSRVIHALVQVCNALSEAHEAGLIHGDLKPSNVMLCRHGGAFDVVKVLDFGLVKDASADSDLTQTRAEAVLGTPLYVSPEAISEPDKVDERSDLYAVGALGYFILTGHPVFEAHTVAEIYAKHLYTDAVPPSHYLANAPPDLEVLILSCLQKAQASRPRSARALRKLLLKCADAGRWTDAHAQAWWEARDKPDSDRPPALQVPVVVNRAV